MKNILSNSSYQTSKDLFNSLSELYPYTIMENNIMQFSNKLKDDGMPNVWGIEDHICALKLKIEDKNIYIIAIANQGGPLGFATKVVDIIHTFAIKNNYKIIISNDESGGYWEKIIAKYNDSIISINSY